jgi:hypothetical protein
LVAQPVLDSAAKPAEDDPGEPPALAGGVSTESQIQLLTLQVSEMGYVLWIQAVSPGAPDGASGVVSANPYDAGWKSSYEDLLAYPALGRIRRGLDPVPAAALEAGAIDQVFAQDLDELPLAASRSLGWGED